MGNKRKGALIIAVILSLIAAFIYAKSELCKMVTQNVTSPLPAALPLQGVYDYGDIGSPACLFHLDQIGRAGFDLVLCYTSGSSGSSPEQQRAYLDRAEANGLQVIWDFNELVGDDSAPTTAAAVAIAVKDHPATWGYYVGDENGPDQADAVREMADAIHAADPLHPRLFVGNYSSNELVSFVDSAEYLGLDVYPIGQSDNSQAMVSQAGYIATDLRRFNAYHRKRSVLVLQAFNWVEDRRAPVNWKHQRWPSCDEMRSMRDLAIEQGQPEIILWFSYHHLQKDPCHWDSLVRAAFAPVAENLL